MTHSVGFVASTPTSRSTLCRVASRRSLCSQNPGNKALSANISHPRCKLDAVPYPSRTASDENAIPSDAVFLDTLSKGDKLTGTVVDVGGANSLWIDAGVVRRARGGILRKVNGRLRFERKMVRGMKEKPTSHVFVKPKEKMGAKIEVLVRRVDASAGRFEVRRVRRQAPFSDRRRSRLPSWPVEDGRLLCSVETGEKLRGTVVCVGSYGALVDCGIARENMRGELRSVSGLLQRKQFQSDWATEADVVVRDNTARVLRPEDEVDVYVRAALPANGKLRLSAVPISAEDLARELMERRRVVRRLRALRRQSLKQMEEGSTVDGLVQAVREYGAFVRIGSHLSGLIHFKKMGEYRDDWRQLLQRNVEVTVRINTINEGKFDLELIRICDGEVASNTDEVEHADDESSLNVFDRGKAAPVDEAESRATLDRIEDVTSSSDSEYSGESSEDEEAEVDSFERMSSDDYLEDKYG